MYIKRVLSLIDKLNNQCFKYFYQIEYFDILLSIVNYLLHVLLHRCFFKQIKVIQLYLKVFFKHEKAAQL